MQKKVKLFTAPGCPYCELTKEFLKEHNIEFEEIDVTRDKKGLDEMVKKSGQMGVPVLEIEEEIIVGFNRERIEELLNIQD